jgi:hypothetical protein
MVKEWLIAFMILLLVPTVYADCTVLSGGIGASDFNTSLLENATSGSGSVIANNGVAQLVGDNNWNHAILETVGSYNVSSTAYDFSWDWKTSDIVSDSVGGFGDSYSPMNGYFYLGTHSSQTWIECRDWSHNYPSQLCSVQPANGNTWYHMDLRIYPNGTGYYWVNGTLEYSGDVDFNNATKPFSVQLNTNGVTDYATNIVVVNQTCLESPAPPTTTTTTTTAPATGGYMFVSLIVFVLAITGMLATVKMDMDVKSMIKIVVIVAVLIAVIVAIIALH